LNAPVNKQHLKKKGYISKNFKRDEFACKCGCGFDTVDSELIFVLQWLRDVVDAPIKVNSGCRCASHNASVGGAPSSQHVLGRAADIVTSAEPPHRIHEILDRTFGDKLSLGLYDDFVHVDTRTEGGRRWNQQT
jgi:uncharacterized protein YcbK (DUF882 family)